MAVHLNWLTVVNQFREKFAESFNNKSKKAYLDSISTEKSTIDGASVKWVNVLILDALIKFIQGDTPNPTRKPRRRHFDQHVVLRECIELSVSTSNNSRDTGTSQLQHSMGEGRRVDEVELNDLSPILCYQPKFEASNSNFPVNTTMSIQSPFTDTDKENDEEDEIIDIHLVLPQSTQYWRSIEEFMAHCTHNAPKDRFVGRYLSTITSLRESLIAVTQNRYTLQDIIVQLVEECVAKKVDELSEEDTESWDEVSQPQYLPIPAPFLMLYEQQLTNNMVNE